MHDPRVGRFFAVDPLQKAFHWNSSYAFSENRVIDAYELEGAENVLIHGTLTPFVQEPFEMKDNVYYDYLKDFAQEMSGTDVFSSGMWSGRGESASAKKVAAQDIFTKIIEKRNSAGLIKEPIFILGHSHGGNVGIMVVNLLNEYYDSLGEDVYKPKIILVTLNTPNRREIQINNYLGVSHYNIYAKNDGMSLAGKVDLLRGMNYKQKYDKAALNIEYDDQTAGFFNGTWNHMGTWEENFDEWKPKFDEALEKLNRRMEKFREKLKNRKLKKTKVKVEKDKIKSPRYF